MKKLRILVVDDTQANIEAAKVASNEFPQHEFVFMTSANESFKQIEKFDAVVTDLFFPEKPCEEMMETYEKMQAVYSEENRSVKYLAEIEKFLFKDISLRERLEKNLSYVRDGSKHGFPLGLSIMIKANQQYKKTCLISSIGGDHNNHGGVDGVIILLPLVDRGILSVRTQWGTCSYGGINFADTGTAKNEPEIWEKAIHCILAQ